MLRGFVVQPCEGNAARRRAAGKCRGVRFDGADGFRGAFADPDAVYAELRSICLGWMMEGGSFTHLPARHSMCENERYNCRSAVDGLIKYRHEQVKDFVIEQKPGRRRGKERE